ncbi:MAG: CcoQ/FixQ family Cbb3-type cytochrome c oxidase assembly chaperone [Xanthomonadaceae bacterium]|nr:CcoQ/FixQ family Cbb3-type cytochrome c oxidase assembly chaperone [Xanthomonadaceae bacterium]MDE1964309.1 cbb3-type cytochrome c oxidase subunit 3 [Xanthomonadaceae bacterium]
MSHDAWGFLAGAVTVVLMLTFVGIWVWAWRKRHREVFQRMAGLPMEDAAEPTAGDDAGEQR